MSDLDVLPCPFCGSEIKHIETWAKSFKPPRLYHEWHHVEDRDCPVKDHGKIVHKATDDPKDQQWVVRRLNQRAVAGQPSQVRQEGSDGAGA